MSCFDFNYLKVDWSLQTQTSPGATFVLLRKRHATQRGHDNSLVGEGGGDLTWAFAGAHGYLPPWRLITISKIMICMQADEVHTINIIQWN